VRALITLHNNAQVSICGRTGVLTHLDQMGAPTKHQMTLKLLPRLKPGEPLVVACVHNEVSTLGVIKSVLHRGDDATT
jgi:hypothetical protein